MLRFLRRMRDRKALEDPIALVLIQTEWRVFSRTDIALLLREALGRNVPVSEIEEEGPIKHRFSLDGYEIGFSTLDHPYLEIHSDPPGAWYVDAVERQRAVIALDVWAAPSGGSRRAAIPLVARIGGRLADERTLAFVMTHLGAARPATPEAIAALREGRVNDAFPPAPGFNKRPRP